MPNNRTIQSLLAAPSQLAECKAKRIAWVRETFAALREMDKRCGEAASRMTDEEFDRLFDEEQAKVDAFLDPLRDAADRDLWPRHLYVGGI
jgi:hypothetical protein